MKIFWLGIALLTACGTDADPSGSYNGTLTITLTGGNVVESTLANIQPEQDNIELFGNGMPSLSGAIQGTSWSGRAVSFDCAQYGCWLDIDQMRYDVTAASGTLDGDLLSLTFSGARSGGPAFSASFMGTLEPGTN